MSLEDDVRLLARARPLAALPREALQLLAFSCPKRRLGAGEALFGAGEAADGAFFVLVGEIVLRIGENERRAGAGVLIGKSALLAESARAADATATTDSTVLAIPRETFRRVLSEFPASAAKIQRMQTVRTAALVGALDGLRQRNFAAAKHGA